MNLYDFMKKKADEGESDIIKIMQEYYEEFLGEDKESFMFLLFSDILRSVADGLDNYSASELAEISEEEVRQLSNKYFGFDGWEFALDTSPLLVYNATVSVPDADENSYVAFMDNVYGIDEKSARQGYKVAKRYTELRKKVFHGSG